MKFEVIDQGRMTVATEFLPLLRRNQLDSFERVMAADGGEVVRDFPGRRTVRLALAAADGAAKQPVFLKRYEPRYLSFPRRVLRLIRWPGADDEARREWEMIQRVGALGIRTATPIAVGQEASGGTVVRSFLLTAEITGAIEGHTFLKGSAPPDRRRFLERVAELARQFHQAGFVHKDFYLGHILVVPGDPEPQLHLIDLQRVTQPCWFKPRWRAKDLGALAYSTLNAGATNAELMQGYLVYKQRQHLGRADQRTARQILRRVAWLRSRRPKHG